LSDVHDEEGTPSGAKDAAPETMENIGLPPPAGARPPADAPPVPRQERPVGTPLDELDFEYLVEIGRDMNPVDSWSGTPWRLRTSGPEYEPEAQWHLKAGGPDHPRCRRLPKRDANHTENARKAAEDHLRLANEAVFKAYDDNPTPYPRGAPKLLDSRELLYTDSGGGVGMSDTRGGVSGGPPIFIRHRDPRGYPMLTPVDVLVDEFWRVESLPASQFLPQQGGREPKVPLNAAYHSIKRLTLLAAAGDEDRVHDLMMINALLEAMSTPVPDGSGDARDAEIAMTRQNGRKDEATIGDMYGATRKRSEKFVLQGESDSPAEEN